MPSCICSGGKLELYTGGYDDFEKRRAEKARLLSAFAAKQEAERAHLQSFVDRFRAKASKAAQAQSRMKRLAKMEPVAATIEERVAPFTLPSPDPPAGAAADAAGSGRRSAMAASRCCGT